MSYIIIAVLLDLIFGDPYNLPHLIKLMGNIISLEEKAVRKIFKTDNGLLFGGILMVAINICLSIFPTYYLFKILPGYLSKIARVIIYYYCISARTLDFEASMVGTELSKSLEKGRDRLKYIVGRDTTELSKEEVITATVETVAENTSDGVIAPLFYIYILGPIGGILYKFINTMDSMIAYKNEKYFYLGKAAAIVDDIFNYIPARLTGVLMAIQTFNIEKIKKAFRYMKEFGRAHASPNAGYPESVIASILDIKLGGGHYYFGEYVEKPDIGYGLKKVELDDISKTIKVMYKTEFLLIILMIVTEFITKFHFFVTITFF